MKGNPLKDEGQWMAGWVGVDSPLGGIRCEHFDFVHCRLPAWRVSWTEPADLSAPPEIPVNAVGSFGLLISERVVTKPDELVGQEMSTSDSILA